MLRESVYDELIDWRREAKEEIKTLRFYPNCCQLVELKHREHKHYQNVFACSICGEVILKKGYIRMGSGSGYRNFQRYNQRRRMLKE
ncbi:MAG: hypothetical protein GPJ52_03825 [Candidatus Heimdallarchaeota archaeon]|nr:hypothetical protein [Candidatus Heimdallarchaeota archaeon]